MEGMDRKLDALLSAYREACPDPEGSPGFMPGLWQRIEARRSETTFIMRWVAQACAVAAITVTLFIGTVLIPRFQGEPSESASYIDALAADRATDFAEVAPGGDLL